MAMIDPNVRMSIDSLGYGSVVVLLKSAPPAVADGGHGAQEARPAKQSIPDVFLKVLPDTAGLRRASETAEKKGIDRAALTGPDADVRPPMQAPKRLSLEQLGMECGFLDEQGLDALAGNESVEAIVSQGSLSLELIRPGSSAGVPASLTTMDWYLKHIQVRHLLDRGLSGKGIGVAHLDTGVDSTHPDLEGHVAKFMELDDDGAPKTGTLTILDTASHGTQTAGLICGGVYGKREIGAAPEAKLYSCVVIPEGNVLQRILGGIEWVLANRDSVRVLCMAVGISGIEPEGPGDARIAHMKRLIDACVDARILPVVAIGNDGPGKCRTPGNFSSVLSVGCVDQNDRVMKKSSSGSYSRDENPYVPTVVAPGDEGLLLAMPGGGHKNGYWGTSLAAALVSGVAALLFEAKPTATPRQIIEAIKHSGQKLPVDSPLRYGYGLIDAKVALDFVESNK